MATTDEWSVGYARQAAADFETFELMQGQPVPECHKLQFLQMACEKLVKACLCGEGTQPQSLQASHAYVSANLPRILRQQAVYWNFSGGKARNALETARILAREIEILAPSVRRGGQRPDNCEYPWEDGESRLHLPLEWSFHPSALIVMPAGIAVLKLIRGAIDRLIH
ncbi:MAG: hypothetical protein ACYC61_11930 [Isosphaeraceae bacterium]